MKMDCQDVQRLLSPYHDRELASDVANEVAGHIAVCENCAKQLQSIRKLSQLAQTLIDPVCPDKFPDLRVFLVEKSRPIAGLQQGLAHRKVLLIVSAAAILLLAAVLFWTNSRRHHAHELAESFAPFFHEFVRSPDAADSILAVKYNGRPVTLEESAEFLKYRPAIAAGLPNGYTLQSAYVIKMPCCKCFQVNLQREDGSKLVAFEHDGDEPDWFGNRPTKTATIHGQSVRIVQFDGFISASWKNGERYLTLVGARSSAELDQLFECWATIDNG